MLPPKLNQLFRKNRPETVPILFNIDGKSRVSYGAEKFEPDKGGSMEKDGPDYQTKVNTDQLSSSSQFPAGVYFVLLSKFFESFAANGVRSILALFLRDSLMLSEDLSTIVLHIFNFFSQFCPIFGALLADCFIGNVRAVSYFLVVYLVGFVGITMSTMPFMKNEFFSINSLVYLCLLLISVGNGSIRANITSLGAEQFKQPQQMKGLQRYFSHYYFFYTAGILLSKTVTPSIRGATSNSYLAVFGTLALMFSCCYLIFTLGIRFYKKRSNNAEDTHILAKVVECVFKSLKLKILKPWNGKFLENCIEDYGLDFVNNVKQIFHITKLFLPLPIYWSLLAQQDSTWTFQSTKMETKIGSIYIEPDQVKAIGPIILLFLIPCWDNIKIALEKNGVIITPLTSVVLGGGSASLSFICAGLLEIYIQNHPLGTVSVLWQFPQFFFIMMGEVLLAIPGLAFAFTQAPSFMKSVLTAFWFINNAFGNLIVVVITKLKPVQNQSIEYFLYSILCSVGVSIFALMARNYRNQQTNGESSVINV